ncbi:MAG: SPOR domain-containing protein [Bacteroidales bacterium]
MNPEPFIIQKLYEGESVRLKGLGIFHPVDKQAQVHPGDHQFDPPGRTVDFEYNPGESDELFVDYIADQLNISRDKALQETERYSAGIIKDLSSGKKVQLQNIGFLYYDSRGKVKFEADLQANFSKGSYGLQSFKAKPVTSGDKATTQSAATQKQSKTQAKPKKGKSQKKKGKKTAAIWLILLAIVLIAGAAGFYFQDKWTYWLKEKREITEVEKPIDTPGQDEPASFSESAPPEETQAADTGLTTADKKAVPPGKQDKPKAEKDQEKTTKSGQASEGDFLIIAGCFRSEENAKGLKDDLLRKGYEASIQGKTPYGLHRVVYGVYPNRREALNTLHKILEKEEEQAWIDRY